MNLFEELDKLGFGSIEEEPETNMTYRWASGTEYRCLYTEAAVIIVSEVLNTMQYVVYMDIGLDEHDISLELLTAEEALILVQETLASL